MSLIFQTTFQNVYYLIIYIQIITKSARLIFLLQRTGQKTQRKTVITTLVSLTTLADVYYRTCNYSHQPGSREGGVSHNYAISESHSSCVNSGLAKRPLLRSRIISGRDFCNVAQVQTSQNARASRPVLHISADRATLERRLENVYLAIFVQKSTSLRLKIETTYEEWILNVIFIIMKQYIFSISELLKFQLRDYIYIDCFHS
ncbi:Hypothetical_protein [Hexamita inflata]|uniref:Hypothetical_protein n=1 Tax=Hexamita inflata TaxID=28002 RepID=A0AA86QS92_9EUKA|nr:Hypothetical protein HINF_LOCUS21215 [Hexamita inflata]CAI9957080.1 Hypothetical protein HINF_LOCUS44725 [Hexamita inflata]